MFTIALPSSQATCLSAWLQKRTAEASSQAASEQLAAFAAQLDDARWVGRWLREEARLGISSNDAIAIAAACQEAIKQARLSKEEENALLPFIAQLEQLAPSQSPQFSCPASLALAQAEPTR